MSSPTGGPPTSSPTAASSWPARASPSGATGPSSPSASSRWPARCSPSASTTAGRSTSPCPCASTPTPPSPAGATRCGRRRSRPWPSWFLPCSWSPIGRRSFWAVLFPSWAVAAVLLGQAQQTKRDQLRALQERARFLEETREEEARRRVAEERVRIARDLHDVVAHSLASISVQAGVGAHVIDQRARGGPGRAARHQGGQRRGARRAAGDPRRAPAGGRGRRPRRTRPPGSSDLDRPGGSGAAGPASVDAGGRRATPDRCRPPSTWPPTASCRSRSPT